MIPEKLMLLAWLSRFAPEDIHDVCNDVRSPSPWTGPRGTRLVVDDAVRVVQVPLTGLRDECLGRLPVERRAGVQDRVRPLEEDVRLSVLERDGGTLTGHCNGLHAEVALPPLRLEDHLRTAEVRPTAD